MVHHKWLIIKKMYVNQIQYGDLLFESRMTSRRLRELRQRIISLVCFVNNAIHPWPQVMPICGREMPPGFTPAICLRRNFVYISYLENQRDKSLNQRFYNIVFNSHANFREKLSKALTARPQKPKLSWILKQIFEDGGHRTCTRTLAGKHTRKSASFW